MLIPGDEAQLFFKLHRALLCFVAMRSGTYQRPRLVEDFLKEHTAEQLVAFRDRLASHPEWIESFVEENPFDFTDSELEIVRGFRHAIHGTFYVLQHLQKYSVFLGGDPQRVFGVLGLYDELDAMLPPHLRPLMAITTLLPFLGRIVYDGLIASHPIHFGPGIRRTLKAEASRAKSRYGVITSLPASTEEAVESPEAQMRRYLRTQQSREEHADEIMAVVARNPRLRDLYHQEMGRLAAIRYKRQLHEMGFQGGWFAVLEGVLLGGSTRIEKLQAELRALVPQSKLTWIYYFELRSTSIRRQGAATSRELQ